MAEIWNMLQTMPQEQLWVLGGIVAEIILQIIKRYIWQPGDEAKLKKLVAALLVSAVVAAAAAPATGGFYAAWLAIFLSALGYHEATDKIGAKLAWQQAINRLTGQSSTKQS